VVGPRQGAFGDSQDDDGGIEVGIKDKLMGQVNLVLIGATS